MSAADAAIAQLPAQTAPVIYPACSATCDEERHSKGDHRDEKSIQGWIDSA